MEIKDLIHLGHLGLSLVNHLVAEVFHDPIAVRSSTPSFAWAKFVSQVEPLVGCAYHPLHPHTSLHPSQTILEAAVMPLTVVIFQL